MKKIRSVIAILIISSLIPGIVGACSKGTTSKTTPIVTTTQSVITTTAIPETKTPPVKTTTSPPVTTTKPVVTTLPIKVIFEDNFDSEITGTGPSKWNINKPAGSDVSIDDTVYFGTGGKSAKILDNSATEAPNMIKVIGNQTGKFSYQISIRFAQTNQIIGGVYIGNSTVTGGRFGIENLGVSLAFWSDGYIKYNDNDNDLASWKNVQTYEANKWYTIKVFVDLPKQKYDIYINGAVKLTGVKFRYPMTSLDEIMILGRNELPSSTVWVDGILVTDTSGTNPPSSTTPSAPAAPTAPPTSIKPQLSTSLTKWMNESYDPMTDEYYASPSWNLSNDAKSVTETQNCQPSFFYSDFNAMGQSIHVNVKPLMDPEPDDDYFGFVLGINPGDTKNHNADFILIDWKSSIAGETLTKDFMSSCGPGGSAKIGLALSRVKGVPNVDEFWQHTDQDVSCSPNGEGIFELARGTTSGDKGWEFNKEYDFTFNLSQNSLKIYVDNNLEFDIKGTFKDGRLAFFDFSQANVIYSLSQ